MKLKYIDINGYGLLVDESDDIEIGDYVYQINFERTNPQIIKIETEFQAKIANDKKGSYTKYKIIFAEKELNLDVPILPNWREWQVEQAAKNTTKKYINEREKQTAYLEFIEGTFYIIEGYNHNKAKYTEDDLRKAIRYGFDVGFVSNSANGVKNNLQSEEQFIQSLQKYPKYIVMESEKLFYPANMLKEGEKRPPFRLKLITNSEGKQQGIIKEIIY